MFSFQGDLTMKQYSFILIGAGNRGMTYTREMLKMPEKYKLVAMADTILTLSNSGQRPLDNKLRSILCARLSKPCLCFGNAKRRGRFAQFPIIK